MAGITLSQAEEQLRQWLKADTAVSKSQSYTFEGRSLTRADAKAIQEKMELYSAECKGEG